MIYQISIGGTLFFQGAKSDHILKYQFRILQE